MTQSRNTIHLPFLKSPPSCVMRPTTRLMRSCKYQEKLNNNDVNDDDHYDDSDVDCDNNNKSSWAS